MFFCQSTSELVSHHFSSKFSSKGEMTDCPPLTHLSSVAPLHGMMSDEGVCVVVLQISAD